MPVLKTTFGTMPDGRAVEAYTLENGVLQGRVLNYGAALDALLAPDRKGTPGNVLLGFDTLEARLAGAASYLGETVGRYANRIGGATFCLDGATYPLTANEGGNCLHGAGEFSHALWEVLRLKKNAIVLGYVSPHGAAGFPGHMVATAEYALEGPSLHLAYQAVSDRDTICNMTNHAYFNLAGAGTIDDHRLELRAAHYLPVDGRLLPTGERRPVAGTAFDFRRLRPIGQEAFDHNFCLDGAGLAARVYEPNTGRTMELHANQPGLQFYTGNFLEHPRGGFCLEPQLWPDCPNRHWPGQSCVLRAGARYEFHMTLTFGTN
jgi:aldose 1-epimerase